MSAFGLRPPALALGAACLTVPLFYWNGLFEFALLPRLLLLQVLLIVAAAVWCSWVYRNPILSSASSLNLPILVYFLIAILSILWSRNWVEGTVQASRLLTAFAIYWVAANAISRFEIGRIYQISAIAGVLISCVGICQYLGWGFTFIPTVGNPSATFGYRNFAASYLVISIPVAIAFGLASTRLSHQTLWWSAAALMFLFLVYTRTRGAWLGLGGSLFVTCLVVWRRGRAPHFRIHSTKILILLVAGILVLSLLQPRMEKSGHFGFDERKSDALTTLVKTVSPGDARGRLIVWKHTLEMVLDHPLGVGLGGWQYEYPRYDKGDWISSNAAPQRPHNDFLWILSETGLPGLVCYMWILCVLFKSVWDALVSRPDTTETILGLGIAAGILALLGHSLFSFPKERVAPSLLFWLGVGFAARYSADTRLSRRQLTGSLLLPATLLLLLLAGALAVTYRQILFDTHYLQALGGWRERNWSQVAQQAKLANTWGHLNHRILLLQGLAHHNLGELEMAEQSYQRALRYHPYAGHSALGAVYQDLGHYQLAAKHYSIEFDLYPRSSDAAVGLAEAYDRTDRKNEAIDLLIKATEIAPTSDEFHSRLGRALQQKGDLADALVSYRSAVRLSPGEAKHHNNEGAVLAALARYTEAESAYRNAVSARPDYARPHHNLGDLYAATGDTMKAIRSYRTFVDLWKGDSVYIELTLGKIEALEGTN